MNEKQKQCCVRIPEDLHNEAKAFAYKHGFTLQAWIAYLITDALDGESTIWETEEEEK